MDFRSNEGLYFSLCFLKLLFSSGKGLIILTKLWLKIEEKSTQYVKKLVKTLSEGVAVEYVVAGLATRYTLIDHVNFQTLNCNRLHNKYHNF